MTDKKCPHCSCELERENQIVCIHCGREISGAQGYQRPDKKKFGIFSAYREMFIRMFDFKGRSSRSEYWYVFIMDFIINLIFVLALVGINIAAREAIGPDGIVPKVYVDAVDIVGFITNVYFFALLIPQLSLITRRLHDTNRSMANLIFMFLPPVGIIILYVFLAQKSYPYQNRYDT